VGDPRLAGRVDESTLELFHALVYRGEQEHALDALHGAQRGFPSREVTLEGLDLGRKHRSRRRDVADEGAHAASACARLLHDLEPVRSGGAGHQHRHGQPPFRSRGLVAPGGVLSRGHHASRQ